MENVFKNHGGADKDTALVLAAQQGNNNALDELISRHHAWIYNIVFRMIGNIQDAEDATQEILIKLVTKLDTFKGCSSFRTWLYSIVRNYVFNMSRSKHEYIFTSFDKHKELLNSAPDYEFDKTCDAAMKDLLTSETKIQCLTGMLLCLKRKQRLVFILGAVFSVNSAVGAEIIGISTVNFRQILSRSRKQLKNYLEENCSLVNKSSTCSCASKAIAAEQISLINRSRPLSAGTQLIKIKDLAKTYAPKVDAVLASSAELLYRDQAFYTSPAYTERLRSIVFDEIRV